MKKEGWIRISELEKISGFSRRTIHFYLQEGLLHPPMKTGKTMAYYDEGHITKLRFIKKARNQGLPIAAIKKLMTDSAAQASDTRMPETAPAKSTRKEKSKKTRERIIELGSGFFRSKGLKQTRVSDITSAMHVGKGTFYFYFRDKTELFLECVPRIFNDLFASGWEQIRQIDDPLTRLETRARMVMPVLKEFCAILQLSREAVEETDAKVNALGRQVYHSIRRPIASDIEKGIEGGYFRKMDAGIGASVFIGIMESLNDMQRFDNQSLTPETWKHISELIIHGLVHPPPTG